MGGCCLCSAQSRATERTLLLSTSVSPDSSPIEWYPLQGEPSHLSPIQKIPHRLAQRTVSEVTVNPIKLALSTITATRELLRAKVHDGIKTWSFWLNPTSCLLRFPQPLPPFLYQGHGEFPCGFLIFPSSSIIIY